jgi:hypothetical protein
MNILIEGFHWHYSQLQIPHLSQYPSLTSIEICSRLIGFKLRWIRQGCGEHGRLLSR